jgi:phage shock protein PspC (stress-responsive transcriptional regulator)
MKQVININFQGRVVPIETTAFEILKNYTDSLNRHFINEQGKDEIINDIESRIGELFQERIKKGATCITDDDINAIINSIGRPEDFENFDGETTQTASSSSNNTNQQQANTNSTSATGSKRLYRNENDKVLGGVCSGLANYFNLDVVVVRVIFAILFFAGGFGFLPYLIMWVAVPSTAAQQIGGTRKKLFRDPDNKLLAGVCSGIGNYFGINPWIPRLLFLLPFLSFISKWGHWGGFWSFGDVIRFTFSPTSLIIYIILWIVIPEAFTTSEKLEMKGEKVDMNSIKNSVMEEMKTVSKKAEKFGSEAGAVISDKAKTMSADVQTFAKRNQGGIGNVIAMMVKIFVYFIIGCVLIGIFAGLIGVIGGSIKLYPLKDFLLTGGWQNAYAWGTLIFFIAVPVIGILVWLIRRLTRSKGNSGILVTTFVCLWIIGWVCATLFASSLSNEFRRKSNLPQEEVLLTNPSTNKLIVTTNTPTQNDYGFKKIRWNDFDNFIENIEEDTIRLQNIRINIVKSIDDSFHVQILKEARSRSKESATALASKIQFTARQIDSLLLLDEAIDINKTDKFRNQTVHIMIAVPVGKQIRVADDFRLKLYFDGLSVRDFDNDGYSLEDENRWQTNVDYVMKADGLYTLTGKKADGWNDRKRSRYTYNSGSNEDDYRYNDYDKKADSLRDIQEKKRQQKIDSLQRENEKIDRIKDSLENAININAVPSAISSVLMPGGPAYSSM